MHRTRPPRTRSRTQPHTPRSGDAPCRTAQKGAWAELFGWRHEDVAKECEFLGKAGYLGVKIFPAMEQVTLCLSRRTVSSL